MVRLARAAVGLVLITMAAPSTTFADVDRFGTESPYKNLQSSKQSRKSTRVNRPELPANTFASVANAGGPRWVSVARQYTGTNPTGQKSLWCADFMNLVLERSGMKGTSSRMARSFETYGRRISGPRVGAIAVIGRGKTAGHVGIVTGVDSNGNPILISGNYNNTVAEASYPASRVIAYVWPSS